MELETKLLLVYSLCYMLYKNISISKSSLKDSKSIFYIPVEKEIA